MLWRERRVSEGVRRVRDTSLHRTYDVIDVGERPPRLGVVDVFNCLNANPEQNAVWLSGEAFLRPLTIVSRRIARFLPERQLVGSIFGDFWRSGAALRLLA